MGLTRFSEVFHVVGGSISNFSTAANLPETFFEILQLYLFHQRKVVVVEEEVGVEVNCQALVAVEVEEMCTLSVGLVVEGESGLEAYCHSLKKSRNIAMKCKD